MSSLQQSSIDDFDDVELEDEEKYVTFGKVKFQQNDHINLEEQRTGQEAGLLFEQMESSI